MNPIEDLDARALAIDCQQSIICEAPAGSGKTELLTQRFLALLAKVEKPEQIWAITFTRKAASEMHERIFQALHSASQPEPIEPHKKLSWQLAKAAMNNDKAQNWQLLNQPNRLTIKTFDSLCSILVNHLPVEAKIGPNTAISDYALPLYQEAARNLLIKIEEPSPWQPALKTLLTHFDNQWQSVESLCANMLAIRDQWLMMLPLQFGQNDSMDELKALLDQQWQISINHEIQQVRDQFSAAQWQALYDGYCFSQEQKQTPTSQGLPTSWPEDLNTAQQMIKMLLVADLSKFRKSVTKRDGFPTASAASTEEEKAQFKQAKSSITQLIEEIAQQVSAKSLATFCKLPAPELSKTQWPLIEAVLQLLPILTAQLMMVFKQENKIDFAEVSLKAKLALGNMEDPSDLILQMDYRLQHLLIDEFQDTSSSQVALIEQLISGWQPGDGRTLFCVGDAMQSIYSFRAANVGLFLQAKENGIGDISLTNAKLTSNFRSKAGLIEWFNQEFAEIFPKMENHQLGAVPYSPSTVVHEHGPEPINQKIWQDPEQEANWIAEQIQQGLEQTPDLTVAILVKAKSHSKAVIKALAQKNITYQAVDIDSLASVMAIQDLLTLTIAMTNQEQTLSWYALLRSDFFALNDQQLEQISTQPYDLVSDKLSHWLEGTEHKLATTNLSLINQFILQKHRLPLEQWIEMLWLQLGGAASQNEQQQLQSKRYFELLASFDHDQIMLDANSLTDQVTRLFATQQQQSQIQVMSIHKSKGLQFDWVFMPQLQRQGSHDDKQVLLWQERLGKQGQSELLIAPVARSDGQGDDKYVFLQHLNNVKKSLELARLLYVGVTRAEQRLFLSAVLGLNDKEEIKPPSKSSLMHFLWKHWPNPELCGNSPKQQTYTSPIPISNRLNENWQLPQIEKPSILEKFRLPLVPLENALNHPDLSLNHLASQQGTLIHFVLQAWVETNQVPTEQTIRLKMKQLAISSSVQFELTQKISNLIQQWQNQPTFHWILNSAQKKCEWELVEPASDSLIHHIIDLVVWEKDICWVIDYKTSEPQTNESLDDFLNKEKMQYLPQLQRYQKLLHRKGEKNIRLVLFFVTIGHWLEI